MQRSIYIFAKVILDRFFAILMVFLFSPILIFIAVLVKISSNGPALYWSMRVGAKGKLFAMPKFRTMRTDTPVVATHLLDGAEKWLTPIGSALRRSSLDELPQLWSILVGDMSFVGPRPALFNQFDLISLRQQNGADAVKPGLTGLAQVRGRDDLPIDRKAALDGIYVSELSFCTDVRIVLETITAVFRRSGVLH
jgi:O-antigen biosynthesis protein WbqP